MYNDTKDKASLAEGSNITRIDTTTLLWYLAKPVSDRPNLVRFVSDDREKNETQTVTIEAS